MPEIKNKKISKEDIKKEAKKFLDNFPDFFDFHRLHKGKEAEDKAKALYLSALLSGDPFPKLTVAQAIVETGWFEKPIVGFNLFGQKSTNSQPHTKVMTTEFEKGKKLKKEQLFRSYSTLLEALQDRNEKWSPYLTAENNKSGTLEGGLINITPQNEEERRKSSTKLYATDPKYRKKILEIVDILSGGDDSKGKNLQILNTNDGTAILTKDNKVVPIRDLKEKLNLVNDVYYGDTLDVYPELSNNYLSKLESSVGYNLDESGYTNITDVYTPDGVKTLKDVQMSYLFNNPNYLNSNIISNEILKERFPNSVKDNIPNFNIDEKSQLYRNLKDKKEYEFVEDNVDLGNIENQEDVEKQDNFYNNVESENIPESIVETIGNIPTNNSDLTDYLLSKNDELEQRNLAIASQIYRLKKEQEERDEVRNKELAENKYKSSIEKKKRERAFLSEMIGGLDVSFVERNVGNVSSNVIQRPIIQSSPQPQTYKMGGVKINNSSPFNFTILKDIF